MLSLNALRRSIALFVLCLLPLTCAWAQSATANLSGTVVDEKDSVVPNTRITVQNDATSHKREVTSNSSGAFAVPLLPPGNYTLTALRDGFAPVKLTNIVLNVNDERSLRIQLKPGNISETVNVTSEGPLLNNESPAVGTVVNQQVIENMPLNGRSFQSLIALVPGIVFTNSTPMSPGQFSVNGQRTNANYFSVDGVSGNIGAGAMSTMGNTLSGSTPGWTIAGGTNGLVSVDALQEFRIQTSSYAPEFGRSPGGQVSLVTKSGSNAFHGTAYDYLRNDVFDARNFFNQKPAPKPALRQNNFGGTFGGPIRKDKTFFFFSYEGLRLRLPTTATVNYLPTAAARQQVAAVWKPFINAMQLPNGPVNPDGVTGTATRSFSLPQTMDATSIRLDHQLSNRLTLFGRYNRAPSNAVGSYDGVNRQRNTTNIETATLGVTYVISADIANELRANWSRTIAGGSQFAVDAFGAVQPPDSTLYPSGFTRDDTQIYFGSAGTGTADDPIVNFGPRVGVLSDNVQRQLNIVDTFSWTKGPHQFKFGFDWRRMKPSPSFTPHSIGIYATWADLKAGTFSSCFCSSAGGNTVLLPNYSAFAQDTWKTTNRLTLTYGLRWEVNPAPTSATDRPIYALQGVFDSQPLGLGPAGTPIWRTKYANFAPRVGAAFQLTPSMVLRGGFGLFYDLGVPQTLAQHIAISFPWSRSHTVGEATPHLPFSYSNPSLFQGPPFSLTPGPFTFSQAFDPNLKLPLTYQWNASFARELGKNQTLTLSYVASKGQDMIRFDFLLPPNSNFYQIGVARNGDWSRYDSLQVSFQRRLSRGLQAMLSYTLAKSTDTASQDSTFNTASAAVGATKLSELGDIALNKGYSDFDIRHNFSGAFSYQWPAPAWGRFANALMKGWSLDGVVFAQQGLPINILVNTSVRFNGVLQRMRPDVVPGQPFWLSDPAAPGGRRLNPAAFVRNPNNRPGNFQRNSLRNFPLTQADLALRRRFDLTERVKLDLRVEYFNAFNHPNLALGPYETYLGASFGKFGYATQTQNVSLSGSFWPNSGGSVSQQYGKGGPRSGQLTLKLSF